MKALCKASAAAGLELAEVARPDVRAHDEVLVKVSAAGICGSDLHVDDWTPSYAFITASLPVTLGHEFVGVVQGGAQAGRRVTRRPSATCARCSVCLAGLHHACEHRTGIGMTRDGAFALWVCCA